MISITQALRDIGVECSDRSHPFQIRCPFHGSDVHPSARVYPQNNSFYCWTCKRTYTPVSVTAAYYGISFGAALEALAERYGTKQVMPRGVRVNRLDLVLSELITCLKYLDSEARQQAWQQVDGLLARAAKGYEQATIITEAAKLFNQFWPTLASGSIKGLTGPTPRLH